MCLRSDLAGECPLDPGGYFIVRGTEKVNAHSTCMVHQRAGRLHVLPVQLHTLWVRGCLWDACAVPPTTSSLPHVPPALQQSHH